MEFSFSPKRLVVAVAAALPLMASAADTPSTATARKGFAGYDHPNQYLVKPATTIADNMMPVMQHPAQDKETQQKLAELEKKTGKKPNVVVFLLDDVGWMDVGFNGGGVAVGNPTPDIDAVASQGLILTSAYSQPSSSPTRATILTRVNHAAAVAARSGLRHSGHRKMAYGGKQRVAAAERWL